MNYDFKKIWLLMNDVSVLADEASVALSCSSVARIVCYVTHVKAIVLAITRDDHIALSRFVLQYVPQIP